ncbi:MAG TPA: hypothetical protein VNY73_10465, partial [Bacteroidia bacterium]|nr:hypothetical protein [Bacteroidia bacterium]
MAAKKRRKIIFRVVLVLLLAFAGAVAYFTLAKSNIYLDGKKYKFIFIPTKATYNEMIGMLEEENILENKKTFEWLAAVYDLQDNF